MNEKSYKSYRDTHTWHHLGFESYKCTQCGCYMDGETKMVYKTIFMGQSIVETCDERIVQQVLES